MDIKLLTFNIHKGVGWGPKKTTIDEIHRKLVLSQADIIFLQEVRDSQFELLTAELWPHFSYGQNAVYKKGYHGNAILTKFPIIFSENIDLSLRKYEKRGLLHSIVRMPTHPKLLHLLCVHLGLLAKDRYKQLNFITNYIEDHIPLKDPIIFGGDFNDWRGIATKFLIQKLAFNEAFIQAGKNYAKTFPAWIPMLKLDRIYFRGIEMMSANRLAKKSWRYLSDHLALQADFKV